MRTYRQSSCALLAIAAGLTALTPAAMAQADSSGPGNPAFGDIIVTAQKRAQSLNDVGMSITAQTGDTLLQRGVNNAADLQKVVPGFIFTPTGQGMPVYTLRGMGFYDSGYTSPPAVTIYVDEVPLAFPLFAEGAAFDLERVEVLKGPQGTLFGQNSTGGAINYIAAKPTDELAMGATLSWSRFNLVEAEGFISGPISSNLKARLAVRGETGGAWQYSTSRRDDKNGDKGKIQGRLLLDWDASDSVRLKLNLNGYSDKGDTQAPQFVKSVALPTSLAPQELNDYINNYQPVGDHAREAEWYSERSNKKDMQFYQAALRAEIDLSEDVMLTGVSSYQHLKVNNFNETAGLPIDNQEVWQSGFVKSFNQEVRLSGDTGSLNWLVGASYEWMDSSTRFGVRIPELTVSYVFPDLPNLRYVQAVVDQQTDTYAAFANAEFRLTDSLTLQAGARYTRANRSALSCARDIAVDADGNPTNETGINFTRLQEDLLAAFGIDAAAVPIGPGQCYSLNGVEQNFRPDLGGTPGKLNEDNLSYRIGLNYKTPGGALVYANYSRGYKAGAYVATTPSSTLSWAPAKQERVDAFELGFKAPLADRRVNVNGAAFYYDYRDKQTRGRVPDPLFNLLERMINVPESRVWGIEGEIQTNLMDGLTISASALYLNTKITELETVSQTGILADYNGSPLPYAPKWTGNIDVQYEAGLSDKVNGFIGALFTYRNKTYTTFSVPAAPSEDFAIDGYGLLDLRAGIADPDGSWRLSLFARNVTNKFYVQTFFQGTDTQYRYAGMPRTFGLQLTLRPKL
ncbi:MAG: TonB-dependent receptor [Sphingobium sp.]